MATRINTKFVIALVAVVVVFGAVSAVAVKKLVFKSADQYAHLADEALEKGLAAKEAGDYEVANSFFDQAARNYNAASGKDRSNTEYLRNSMVANESYVCEQTTEAQNRLDMIMGAAKLIHDAPNASLDERAGYYEMLFDRHRSGLAVETGRPWISYISRTSKQELEANPENDLAQYWRGVSGVYMLRNDMPDTDRRIPLDDLQQALERQPDNALLQHHIARWHYNEAERLKDAAGGAPTDASNAQYALGLEASARAYAMAQYDPANACNHMMLLFATPLDDDIRAAISQTLLTLGRQLAENADARGALYASELSQVIAWLGRYKQLVQNEDPEPLDLAVAIGQAMVQDAPDQAEAHQVLAQAQLLRQAYEAAIQTLNAGLATSRPLGPMPYMLDRQSRLSLLFTLAETYTTQAASLDAADPTRRALLDKGYATLERFRSAEGAADRVYVARADYIAGRAALIQNNPQAAIGFLEKANLVFGNRDLKTLTLLARAHDANGNSGEAIKYYELILQIEPRAVTERLRLVRLYTARGGGQALETADGHITQFLEYNPQNLEAWLIKANIYATAEQYAQAAEMVKGLDLDSNPTLVAIYARYLAQAGEPEEALRLVQARLAEDPNDTRAITVLFSLVSEKQERFAQLDLLEANGLKEETVRYYRTVIESDGQVPLDELAELWESQGNSPLQINKQMLTVYAQTGDLEQLRRVLAELVEMAPNDKDVLTWQFNLAVNDKDWDEADRLVRVMLQLNPADRPTIAASNGAFLKAQTLTGRVLSDTAEGATPDLREAVRAYRRALDDASTFVPGWIALGKLYMVEKDWQRARDAFNRAYNIQETNVEATTLLARTMVQTGEVDRALDLYREATRRQPNNRALLEEYLQIEASSGVPRLAMDRRVALREANPNDVANRRALAIMLAEDARYEEALAEIDAIIEIEGPSLSTATAQASVLALNDQTAEGVQALRSYIASLGEDAGEQDYVALALFLVQHGMPEDAEPVIREAISREDPATRMASRQWASILSQTGRFPEATRTYQDLVAAFPADGELKRQLATVFLAMGSYDQAQATLGGVPASANKEILRAQTQLMQGKLDAALAIVRSARQTYDDSSALEVLEARVLSEIGESSLNAGDVAAGRSRLEESIAIYERIVRRNASLYEYRVLIARLENLLGRTEQAVSRLVRIIDENPDVTSARTTLFGLYMEESAKYANQDPRRQQLAGSAYTLLTPLLANSEGNDILLRSAGQAAVEAGNPTTAARHFEAAFAISSNESDLAGLVSALLSAQQPGEALVVLNRAENAEFLANSIRLSAMRAQALANSRRGDEAQNLFTNLLRQTDSPGEIALIINRLSQSALRGRSGEIIDAAIPADRMSPAIDLQLALIAQGQQDWDSVLQRLGKYESDTTNNSNLMYRVRLTLALAYQESGGQDNLLRSKAIYEAILASYGDNIEVLNNLAYLLTDRLLGSNHAQAAVAYAERAIALLNPDAAQLQKAMLYDTLGWAQFKAGDLDAARATLRESIALSPLAVNHKHLGLVHMAAGDKTQAISSMSQARSAARSANDTEQVQEIQRYLDELGS